jgi:hypothetical protein
MSAYNALKSLSVVLGLLLCASPAAAQTGGGGASGGGASGGATSPSAGPATGAGGTLRPANPTGSPGAAGVPGRTTTGIQAGNSPYIRPPSTAGEGTLLERPGAPGGLGSPSAGPRLSPPAVGGSVGSTGGAPGSAASGAGSGDPVIPPTALECSRGWRPESRFSEERLRDLCAERDSGR